MVLPSEQIGTLNNDQLMVLNNTIAYGLGGDDILSTSVGSTGDSTNNYSVLVGGLGNDQYNVANNSTAIILDHGNSPGDVIVATGIGFNSTTTQIVEVDNRHLVTYDTVSGQRLIILDWQASANTIESVQFANGTFTSDYIASNFRTNVGYLGNYTLEQADQLVGNILSTNGITSSSLDLLIGQIQITDSLLSGNFSLF